MSGDSNQQSCCRHSCVQVLCKHVPFYFSWVNTQGGVAGQKVGEYSASPKAATLCPEQPPTHG